MMSSIQKEVGVGESDPVYEEACRIVGQCCLMMAESGLEISRAQVAYQLKTLNWQLLEQSDDSRTATRLAIEQLESGLKG